MLFNLKNMARKGEKNGKINKAKLLNALLEGKTQEQAARIAGSIAEKGCNLRVAVSRAKKDPLFAEVLEKGIKNSFIVKRLKQGLDAQKTLVLKTTKINMDGEKETKQKIHKYADLGMRLNYMDRIIKLRGLVVDAPPPEPTTNNIFNRIESLIFQYGDKASAIEHEQRNTGKSE